ncbi:MAG: SIR2 family protein [Pasteurella sp.]|nr:SIR2 family protein [Pasteurella sp.]
MKYKIPGSLIERINNKQVVIFVGAGLSINAGLPSWKELIDLILVKIQEHEPNYESYQIALNNKAMSPLDVLKKIENKKVHIIRAFYDIMNDYKSATPTVIHALLKDISTQIITSNYDCLLEKQLTEFETVIHTNDLKLQKLRNSEYVQYIFKIHGDIENAQECILLPSQYKKHYSEKENSATITLKNIVSSKSILFVGFSLSDPYINKILDDFRDIFNNYDNEHYVITSEPDKSWGNNIYPLIIESYKETENILQAIIQLTRDKKIPSKKSHDYKISDTQPIGWGSVRRINDISFSTNTISLPNVYVTRNLESSIIKTVNKYKNTSSIIAIIADAGFGKSSILWKANEIFSDKTNDFKCFFYTASELISYFENGTLQQLINESLISYKDYKTLNIKNIFILDTFDVLINQKTICQQIMIFLQGLAKLNFCILLSSRKKEINQVNLQLITPNVVPLYLSEYDDKIEFPAAIRSHCQAFYQNITYSAEEINAQVIRLENAVSSNRRIKDVCLNPLKLRMLFELYAPNSIPEDINTYSLYVEYWNYKVKMDNRGYKESYDTRDLSSAVMFLANFMFLIGAPVVSKTQLSQLMIDGRILKSDIIVLLSRNILIEKDNSIEFFHQTFFEFAAAQFLSKKVSISELLQLLYSPHESKDYFKLPVYEQLLLIYLELTPSKLTANSKINELINTDSIELQNLFLYVHIHSTCGLNIVHDWLLSQIKSTNNSQNNFLKSYINSLYNIGAKRSQEVKEVIEYAWNPNSWQDIEPLIGAFQWLAQNNWEQCNYVIKKYNVIKSVLSLVPSKGTVIESKIISILRYGLQTSRKFVFHNIISICNMLEPQGKLQFLEFFNENITIFIDIEEKDIRQLNEILLGMVQQQDAQGLRKCAKILASMWDTYPFLRLTIKVVEKFEKEKRQLCIAAYCFSKGEWSLVLKNTILVSITSKEPELLHDYLNYFFLETDLLDISSNKSGQDAIKYILQLLNADNNKITVIANFIRVAYINNNNVIKLLYEYFDKLSIEDWINPFKGYKRLLPIALVENIQNATIAHNKICLRPNDHVEDIRLINHTLLNLPFSEKNFLIILKQAKVTHSSAYIFQYIEKYPIKNYKSLLVSESEILEKIVTLSRTSLKSKERAFGYKLLQKLVQQNLCASPHTQIVLAWINNEERHDVVLNIVKLLPFCLDKIDYSDTSLGVLIDLATQFTSSEAEIILITIQSLLKKDSYMSSLSPEVREKLFNFASYSYDNRTKNHSVNRLSLLGYLIKYYISYDLEYANKIAFNLVNSDTINCLKTKQMRTLTSMLKKPFLLLFKQLNDELFHDYYKLLEGSNQELNYFITRMICNSQHPNLDRYLHKITENRRITRRCKQIIHDYKKHIL